MMTLQNDSSDPARRQLETRRHRRRGLLVVSFAVAVFAAVFAAPVSALPPPHYGSGPNYCKAKGNSNSSASFDNVYACASTRSLGPTTFDANGNYSFQCVELVARYLWAVYGIWAGPGSGGDGWELVNVVHRNHPSIPIGTPGRGSVPVAGDVISLGPGGWSNPIDGHTGVVTQANASTGVFTIMSQNAPPRLTGKVDLSGGHQGKVAISSIWTRANWLVLKPPSSPSPTPTPTPPVAPTPTPTPVAGCASPGSTLVAGATLCAGQQLTSANGQYRLVMQTDGNLVLYEPHKALWQSHTFEAGDHLLLQATDGNLVIYNGSNKAVWQAHTYPHAGDRLVVQNDGNVVVYQGSQALWSTGT